MRKKNMIIVKTEYTRVLMSKGRNTTMLGVRLPDDLHEEIIRRAKLHNQSISDWMRSFLRVEFGRQSIDIFQSLVDEKSMSLQNEDMRIRAKMLEGGQKSGDVPAVKDDSTLIGEAAPIGALTRNVAPRANQPCPCGAKWPDGKTKKYKHCCGK
jgi:hypothetical protein